MKNGKTLTRCLQVVRPSLTLISISLSTARHCDIPSNIAVVPFSLFCFFEAQKWLCWKPYSHFKITETK